MNIRKLTPKDKEQFKRLLVDFYIENKKKYSEELQRWEKYKNDEQMIEKTLTNYLTDKKYIPYVAETNGSLVGYIVGEVKEKPHKINDKEGYVQDWFIQIEHRGKKIGNLLFAALTKEFKELNCTHISLDTFVENHSAIDIYRKMGFKDRLLTLRKDL